MFAIFIDDIVDIRSGAQTSVAMLTLFVAPFSCMRITLIVLLAPSVTGLFNFY